MFSVRFMNIPINTFSGIRSDDALDRGAKNLARFSSVIVFTVFFLLWVLNFLCCLLSGIARMTVARARGCEVYT